MSRSFLTHNNLPRHQIYGRINLPQQTIIIHALRMNPQMIFSEHAPKPVGPYSQAVRAGDFLFCAGQIGLSPNSGELVQTSIQAETRQVMENISAVLASQSLKPHNIVKTTIFLTDLEQFAPVNEVYATFCGDHLPARSTVGVSRLPKGARVEIEVIAYYSRV